MLRNKKYVVGTIHENRHGEKFKVIGKCDKSNYRLIKYLGKYQYITETHLFKIAE